MKNFVFTSICLLSLLVTFALAEEDWRTVVFNKAEALHIVSEKEEAERIIKIEPKTADFYSVFLPVMDADRKMKRYAFMRRLEQEPNSINWSDISDWSGRSLPTDKAEKLASVDPNFRQLYENFKALKAVWRGAKHLTKLRNAVFEEHQQEFDKTDELLMKEEKALQEEVNAIIANHGVVPDAANSAAPHAP